MDLSALMDFQLCYVVCPTTDNRQLRRLPIPVHFCSQPNFLMSSIQTEIHNCEKQAALWRDFS